jgi:O-antigen ligase
MEEGEYEKYGLAPATEAKNGENEGGFGVHGDIVNGGGGECQGRFFGRWARKSNVGGMALWRGLGYSAAMLQEDKQILWRISAVMLGMALPSVMLGKAVLFVLLLLGMFSGLMATKDESLRATLKLLVNSRVLLVALVLMASLLVGAALGINPRYASEKWFEVATVGFGAAVLFVTLREMPGRHLELLLKVLAVSTATVAAVALVDALAGEHRLSAAIHGQDMADTPYRLNKMSSVLAVILPFVWARLILKSREGEPFAMRIALPAASFLFVTALVCGGRAGWVGLFAGVGIFLWIASRYHGLVIHKKHWALGLGLVGLSLVLYAYAFGIDFAWQRASIVGEEGVGRGMLSGRLEVWMQALHGVMQAPFFGIGVMNYRNMPGAIDMHPHNWLIQMLLEGGVVSTVIFLILMGLVLVQFGRFAKGNIYGVAALASLVAFLVSGLANTSIFNGWWLSFLMVSTMLGWRAGWGGSELKKRRRAPRVVKGVAGL